MSQVRGVLEIIQHSLVITSKTPLYEFEQPLHLLPSGFELTGLTVQMLESQFH